METESFPTNSETPVVNQMPVKKPSSKLLILLILLVIILATVVGVMVGYFLGFSKNQVVVSAPVVSPAIIISSPAPTPTSDPTVNWKTYIIKAVDVQFKLPTELSSVGDLEEKIFEAPKEDGLNQAIKGKKFCLGFKNKVSFFIKNAYAGGWAGCGPYATDKFIIGGSSVDFVAPRSGDILDDQGFKYENNKYYVKQNLGRFNEIPSDLVTKVINQNGLNIIKIKGKTDLNSGYGFEGSLVDGTIGVLINTNNKTYPGISLFVKTDSVLTENLLDQILSTFKFPE